MTHTLLLRKTGGDNRDDLQLYDGFSVLTRCRIVGDFADL
jgi:hypothetical protein